MRIERDSPEWKELMAKEAEAERKHGRCPCGGHGPLMSHESFEREQERMRKADRRDNWKITGLLVLFLFSCFLLISSCQKHGLEATVKAGLNGLLYFAAAKIVFGRR